MVVIGKGNHIGGGVDSTGRTLEIEPTAAVPLKPMATALPVTREISAVEGPLIGHVRDGMERSISLASRQQPSPPWT
ncbi:hypothetical protein SynBOUM118_02741 [Synechococcus sp. BOUM118]|nr:hypothetical protein SynBOUM118_02741 [Synechococcus sp. BOUM118]